MVLPIVIPPTETYQSTSLVLGVILSTPNISNEYFNNYMMLSCKKTDIMSEMWLDFYGTDWESFRKRGIFEMNLFQFMNFDRKGFLGFIKERIDQGCYILFYYIDEYYLSYSDYYHKKHYIHDVYVYGYEGTSSFWVLAYKMKKLMLFQVNAEEICDGIFSQYIEDEKRNFCSFRPNQFITIDFDASKIMSNICVYLFGEDGNRDDESAYGLMVYEVLEQCIAKICKSSMEGKNQDVDLRDIRLLWEHKKILLEHVNKLIEYGIVDSVFRNRCTQLCNFAQNIFRISMKYNISYKAELLLNVIDYLNVLKEAEIKMLRELYDSYRKFTEKRE